MTSQGRDSKETTSLAAAPTIVDLILVSAWQFAVCAIVRTSGFRAISDDDYARVVIAAEFVRTPSWDPSGTSWLPFPFLLNGSAMMVFGDGLSVARGVAVGAAVLTACLLYWSARILSASRVWAIAGTCGSSMLAYSALLSIATVPEYLSAGCLVFAVSTLTRQAFRLRVLGALSVLTACASRYEAWPVAGAFALFTLHDAWKSQTPKERIGYVIPAALSLAFPLSWLAYGAIHHENPLFFVSRVVDYKRSLGDALPSMGELAADTPRALFFAEPEPVLATLAAWLFASRKASRATGPRRHWRAWFPLALMVITLIVGAARGGAPTHHSERALLSCWLLFALSAATWLSWAHPLGTDDASRTANAAYPSTGVRAMTRLQLSSPLITVTLAIGLGAALRQSNWLFERQPMVNRGEEEALGEEIKRRRLPPPVALLTPDYGYFAIIAAAGKPHEFEVLERHDPRDLKSHPVDALEIWSSEGGCIYVSDKAREEAGDSTLFSTNRLALRRVSACK